MGDQSLQHYAFHGLYGLLQLPLIVLLFVWLRNDRRRGRDEASAEPEQ